MMDIKISDHNNLNDREQKILEVLFLNLAGQANAQVTKQNMMFNPLEKNEENVIFHFQYAWQSSITAEQYEELKTEIERRFTNAVTMCEISQPNITFTENSYLINK